MRKPPPVLRRVIGPREVAEMLGEGKDKTYARLLPRDGSPPELPSWLDGRNRRIDVADVEALIERKKAAAQSPK